MRQAKEALRRSGRTFYLLTGASAPSQSLLRLTHPTEFRVIPKDKETFFQWARTLYGKVFWLMSPERYTGDDFQTRIRRLTDIGIALSAELNLDALLEKIVNYARELTHADAGTLYLLTEDVLCFTILQNSSLGVFEGGTTGNPIHLAPVALNRSNASAYCALEEKTVRIKDVYESEEFDFSGPRRYDMITGYRSQSMLVVPMKNHEGSVIGVLQLMNAIDQATGQVCEFPEDIVGLTEALASQAAVAIANASLIKETKALFESLITMLAVAIDAKSAYTGNHIQRVAQLNVLLARAINEESEGPFASVHFNDKQMEEIRLAGWLHDVGKITTPVSVMDKAVKLQTLFDRMELVRTRFSLAKESLRAQASERKFLLHSQGDNPQHLDEVDVELQRKTEELDQDLLFVENCNLPSEFMDDGKLARLRGIADQVHNIQGKEVSLLTPDELYNLSIRKGSLTDEEIQVMKDHVSNTSMMLMQIPFGKYLRNVPVYAGQHHEKLNGQGYPMGLKGEEIPLQARILAVADFYEALVAKDRPYKKPMSLETAFSIMKRAADSGEIDAEVLDLFIRNKIYADFEAKYQKVLEETGSDI